MAIVKITELPTATTPVSALDVTAVVQGGTTKKASISQLGYLPAGLNAVTRTIQDKLQEVTSVLDFGADPSGATDSTAAIQAAVNAVYAAGGGIVFVPEGTYSISSVIKLNTNVHLRGEGYGSRIISSIVSAITADRADAIDENTPYSNIVVADLYIQAEWGGPSPARLGSTVLLEFCNDCIIENLFVNKGSDACIRVSGYRKGITSFTQSYTNPDFGFAKRNVVRNCTVQEGYLGIELVGGAQCDIVGNSVLTSYQHGIRLAGGGWYCSVNNNKVLTCQHTALYLEGTQYLTVSDNPFLKSERPVTPTAISIGANGRNIVIDGNNVIGLVSDLVLPPGSTQENLTISNNTIDGNCQLGYFQNVNVVGNRVTGNVRLQGTLKGQAKDNIVGNLFVDDPANMVAAGGEISYVDNYLDSSGLPALPTTQPSILGVLATVPSTGTFRQGDIVLKSAPSPSVSDHIGWVCTEAGTPGIWANFGVIQSPYATTISGRRIGNNQTRTILSFTVPNGAYVIWLSIKLLLSRAPSDSVGQSRIIEKQIVIARDTGVGCVIDDSLSTNNYEELTTTVGGARTPAASALAAAIVSGGVTDPQVIDVTALFESTTFNIYGAYSIEIQSTSPLSVFGFVGA